MCNRAWGRVCDVLGRMFRGCGTGLVFLALVTAAGCGSPGQAPIGRVAQSLSGPTFVQMNYATPQNPVSTVPVSFPAAQSAGNLNVVVVGWNDTAAQVASVIDSKGNSYQLAVGPTMRPGELTQSIYYAKNIAAAAAGANTVTVTFTVAAIWPDVRTLEYAGIDPVNPVDVSAAGTGTNATSSTPAVTTTSASDLLFAANTVASSTAGPGSGWTNRVITQPDGDIAEDKAVTAIGSYSSTAPLTGAASWLMQMVAFRVGSSQPPSAPTGLGATAISSNQINLSWTASSGSVASYLVERCVGPGCINFSQIGSTTGTTFANTALVASASYSYRVRATDGANFSGYSNVASASTLPPPTNPSNLTANAVSGSQINLSWTASTGSVTSYLIESCAGAGCTNFLQIGSATGTTYSSTGLVASATYVYRVRASDGAGNLSGYSNTASAATLSPPTSPSNLTATAISSSQINLSWTASSGNVASYLIERCSGAGCTNFSQIGSTTGTTIANTALVASTSYSYRVRAIDGANFSGYSNVASASTLPPPSSPSNLTATAISSSQINSSWTASTGSVASYLIERCQGAGCSTFAQIATSTTTTYSDTNVSPGTTYGYRVRAADAANNFSGYSNIAMATTSGAPIVPTLIQSSYATPQSPVSSVSLTYTSGQWRGDLSVVVVGWNDSVAQVTSVVDSKHNTYVLAVATVVTDAGLSQSVYYASNIANANPGENTVTVRFNTRAQYADVRILEYRSIAATNPVDVTVARASTTNPSNSGSVLTTNNADLLFAANIVQAVTTGPGPGFTMRLLTSPDGDIVEDRVVSTTGSYSATAPLNGTAGWWIMKMVAFKTAAPPAVLPPTVAVTSPAAGATLTGTVTVTLTASSPSSGIEATQVLVDGVPATPPDVTPPYSFSLDTTKFSNGTHSVSATAVDSGRNTAYATPVSVTFSNANPGNPAVTGLWSGITSLPIVPVHVAQLPAGKILMWDGQGFGFDGRVWDSLTYAVTGVPIPINAFCTAHEQMSDGRIFLAGGHNGGAHLGLTAANAFDPVTQSWTVLPDMAYPRWYPTATALPDGTLFVLSGESNCGECDVPVAEIYAPSTNSWTHLTDAPFVFPYYPHVYVLTSGRLLVAGTSEAPIVSQAFDLTRHTWTSGGGAAVDGGSSVMYRPDKILKTGTSTDPDQPSTPSAATAYVIDMGQPSPAWRAVTSMNFARTYHTLTVLPDGNVLASGGGPTTAATDTANAILEVEMWSPATESWTTLGRMHAPRLYHSSALLMPDARVLILGGGRFDDSILAPTDQFSAEFFAPPYLFRGPRPVITSAPSSLQYGQPFTVQTPDAARIASVSLLRLGSVTHAINMAQRFVPLAFTTGAGSLTATAPANSNIATPGNYMLFLVDTSGVPSISAPVRL